MQKGILNYDYIKQAVEIPLLFKVYLTKNKKITNSKKILIINTCLIGDITASLSAIRQFIKNRKGTKIDLIVPPPMKCVMEKVSGVNNVYTAKSVSNRNIEQINISEKELNLLKKNNYDLVLVVRLSKDAYNLLNKLKFNTIKVSPISYTKYIFHLLKKIIYRGKVKQYREVNFEWVGEKPKQLKFEEIFNLSEKDYEKIGSMPEMKDKSKKIILHAATGWQKHWENEKWVELIKKINKLGNFKFIFIGAEKEEEEDFKQIEKQLKFKVYSVIKKVNLLELFLMMRRSDYFIGIDSGPMNMAHLADLRSVSLVGPGPKHFMPIDSKDIVIDKSTCHCTQMFCFKNAKCMKKIQVNDVYNGFKKLLKQESKK